MPPEVALPLPSVNPNLKSKKNLTNPPKYAILKPPNPAAPPPKGSLAMFKTKLVSSLEKPFLNSRIEDYKPLSFIRMMKNQRLSFQLNLQNRAKCRMPL